MHLLLTVHFKNLHTFNIETLITGTEVINFVKNISGHFYHFYQAAVTV